jgi:cysteine desulfurase
MQGRVYMDYNATTPVDPEVRAAVIEGLDLYGNASSLHEDGRRARARIEDARAAVGALINAPAASVYFTSGGSESNNTVISTMGRLARKGDRNEIITTAIEHPCVLNASRFLAEGGLTVHFLPVDEYGRVSMDEYRKVLSEKTLLVSIMMANNEIGTIQDIKALAALAHEKGAFFHTDAVQAVGKVLVDVEDLGVDYLTLSAHKLYAPKGVGGLYVRSRKPIEPLIHGGHQEGGVRAGTYNNPGIIGFGKAAQLAKSRLASEEPRLRALRARLMKGLTERVSRAKVNGHPDFVLPNTLNVSFPGAEGEAILLSMDLDGIDASTGSACASGSLDPSHVLMAIGVGPELAHGSIRFSMGKYTNEEEVDRVVAALPPIIKRLRGMSTLSA